MTNAAYDTKADLKRQCYMIARQLDYGFDLEECRQCGADRKGAAWSCPECGESLSASGLDFLEGALDIQFIVAGDRETVYGAEILVAFGGPNIWINTKYRTVTGTWGGARVVETYSGDALGLDDDIQALWEC